MRIRIGRVTARILVVLLYPLYLGSRVIAYLSGYRKPVYVNTLEGDPLAYTGDKPVVVGLWHEGLVFWDDMAAVVDQMKTEFAGQCEFAYVEVTSHAIEKAYDVPVVPAVVLRHRGAKVTRWCNLVTVEQLREAIAGVIS